MTGSTIRPRSTRAAAPGAPAAGVAAAAGPGATRPAFAHASEAELARILDFYDVRWEYEPHTFPILWNLDGDVVESFSPDFWLPELGMYVELTTLKQRLVRKKNRKLRRLRELYPDVRIKLFYARDFRALMLKYGRIDGVEALSGTAGQIGGPDPDGAGVADPVAAAAPPSPAAGQLVVPVARSVAPDAASAEPDGGPVERRSRSARRRVRQRAARRAGLAAEAAPAPRSEREARR